MIVFFDIFAKNKYSTTYLLKNLLLKLKTKTFHGICYK